MIDQDEKIQVAESMQKYGGSFVKALGLALIKADRINTARIQNAFPEYWKQYKKVKVNLR